MRFLIDANLSPQTASWINTQGHDALHVADVGLLKASDEEILRHASQDDRIVVTMDMDFSEIVALKQLVVPGIVLLRLDSPTPPRIKDRLMYFLKNFGAEPIAHAVIVLEDVHIRLRKLPIE